MPDLMRRANHSADLTRKYERKMNQASSKRLQKFYGRKVKKHRNRNRSLIQQAMVAGILTPEMIDPTFDSYIV